MTRFGRGPAPLQTEKAYVADTNLLDQVFCAKLMGGRANRDFPVGVVKNIFSNRLHPPFTASSTASDLEKAHVGEWSSTTYASGDIRKTNTFPQDVHHSHVKNFDKAMELLKQQWTDRYATIQGHHSGRIQPVPASRSGERMGEWSSTPLARDILQKPFPFLKMSHEMREEFRQAMGCSNSGRRFATIQGHHSEEMQYEMLLKDYLKKLPQGGPTTGRRHERVVCWSVQTTRFRWNHSGNKMNKVCRDCLHPDWRERVARARGHPGDRGSSVLRQQHRKALQCWLKAQCTIPLLGYSVDDTIPYELTSFRLSQSKSIHNRGGELKQRWLRKSSSGCDRRDAKCPQTQQPSMKHDGQQQHAESGH
ncbi:FYVE, RhoGEF and PH domain-containing protein 4 isoform X1 [Lates japonicus]|uniref:FYVE, RhoGEF and PH domain-containing protein 4 isoform X1 n=1 Tax=Lates japonicus TaxID=270547 RepID=A0AAD3R9J1_LATJO|nr:FYVE, RhoGEF and PH domain-containing protein 4 isoform X1 [Lates japonicus]